MLTDQQKQIEAVREKIFLIVQDEESVCRKCDAWDVQGHYCYAKTPRNCKKTEQILSLPEIAILDKDQSKLEVPYPTLIKQYPNNCAEPRQDD